MQPTPEEHWRAIPGWEGRYEVSDQGRVRSLTTWSRNQFGPRIASPPRRSLRSWRGGIRTGTHGTGERPGHRALTHRDHLPPLRHLLIDLGT